MVRHTAKVWLQRQFIRERQIRELQSFKYFDSALLLWQCGFFPTVPFFFYLRPLLFSSVFFLHSFPNFSWSDWFVQTKTYFYVLILKSILNGIRLTIKSVPLDSINTYFGGTRQCSYHTIYNNISEWTIKHPIVQWGLLCVNVPCAPTMIQPMELLRVAMMKWKM